MPLGGTGSCWPANTSMRWRTGSQIANEYVRPAGPGRAGTSDHPPHAGGVSEKLAVTFLFVSVINVAGFALPDRSPLQDENEAPSPATAETVTVVPGG